MIESMAASSLVELSTFGKHTLLLSLSRQPPASTTPFGRVTRSREKARSTTKAPSPSAGNEAIVYIDLGTEDTLPPIVGKEHVTMQPLSTVHPVKMTTTKSIGTDSTLPTERGNTKLQVSVDRKVAHLEERLQKYEILDHHLKEENVLLKERITKLDQQLAEGKGKQAFLAKRVQKWYDEF